MPTDKPAEKTAMPKAEFRALRPISMPDGKTFYEPGDIVVGLSPGDITWMKEQGVIQDPDAPWTPEKPQEAPELPEVPEGTPMPPDSSLDRRDPFADQDEQVATFQPEKE